MVGQDIDRVFNLLHRIDVRLGMGVHTKNTGGNKMILEKMDTFVRLTKEAIETDEKLDIGFPDLYRSVGFSVQTLRETVGFECNCYVDGHSFYRGDTFQECLSQILTEKIK